MAYPADVTAVAATPSGALDLGDTTPTHTALHTQIRTALQSIVTELGSTPHGTAADLSARLTAIEARLTSLESRVTILETGSPPPAGGTTITVPFTGTNGAAWPSPAGAAFAPLATSAGSSATIQNNRGRINAPGIGGYGGIHTMGFTPSNQLFTMSVDLIVTADNVANEALQRVVWRTPDGVQLYALEFLAYQSYLEVFRQDASFVRDTKGSASGLAIITGDILHVKVQTLAGGQHQVKWWKNSATEPGSPNITFTDSVLATGSIALWGQCGTAGIAKTFDFDNFVITPAA